MHATADALEGLAAGRGLAVDRDARIVLRADGPVPGKVGLVSGGGSGHEPLHSGFVGPGMLDAACVGELFTSPVPWQITEATRRVEAGAGVLYIVKNHTGDVLNFSMAAELAADAGIAVETVVVRDDAALAGDHPGAGRRGIAATVLVEKIAGAAAERGLPLSEVAALARRVADGSRSLGVALPEKSGTEIEFGIGIHGEPGRRRIPVGPAADLVAQLLDPILADLECRRGTEVITFVNGLGGTRLSGLCLIYDEVAAVLARAEVRAVRSLVGSYVTSRGQSGCSVTLSKVDPDVLELWDAPVLTQALRWGRWSG
ncbi:dihydroxyacetone kinase subunit DhaK [Amycolatopsis jiangsuensis]|uniref:Dihydroxyacetone kinase-like protein n=1 Tax=Amycolatopsis jiangsuensis TaxID=1181879 RepID=A0A840IQ10_9PSEU|nr:dihydroxyacetone kinase subunit DhaK [Amycolatopsis jiangsuensis]MBB4683467.1 dihydroxyacetone kinase-like protein [Amycolatopsis jiangsuensis]